MTEIFCGSKNLDCSFQASYSMWPCRCYLQHQGGSKGSWDIRLHSNWVVQAK